MSHKYNTQKYFVSRQIYHPDGERFVEIAVGGMDYANPDMVTPVFRSLGEGKEFYDPREAAEASIKIRDAWKANKSQEEVFIGYGFTSGMTMPFSSSTDDEVLAWAEKAYEALDKCDYCGKVLKDEVFTNELGDNYCSNNCAENGYRSDAEANEEGLKMSHFNKEKFAQDITDSFFHNLSGRAKTANYNGKFEMSPELMDVFNKFYDDVENHITNEFGKR